LSSLKKGRERSKITKFEGIIVEIFPNLMKTINSQIQAQKILSTKNMKKYGAP
jgi:hypothetical protein